MTTTEVGYDVPMARVLPPRAPTLTDRILDAIGGVQALLGVLEVIARDPD